MSANIYKIKTTVNISVVLFFAGVLLMPRAYPQAGQVDGLWTDANGVNHQCPPDCGGPSGSSSGGSYGVNPYSMAYDFGAMIWSMGQQAQQQNQELMRRQELQRQEAARIARENQLRREEAQRQAHAQLMSELFLLNSPGNESPEPTGVNAGKDLEFLPMIDDTKLKPAGTSFFGLGGGKDAGEFPDTFEAKTQAAVYVLRKAYEASPEKAASLEDYAMGMLDGKDAGRIVIDDGAVPVLGEEGLKRFQQANIDYRRAADNRLSEVKVSADANVKFINAQSAYKRLSASGKSDTASFDELKKLYRQSLEAFARLQSAQSNAGWLDRLRRLRLRELAFPKTKTIADILAEERKNIEPTPADRYRHARFTVLNREIAGEVEASIWKNYRRINDPRLQKRLDALLERLQAVSDYPGQPREVKIFDGNNCYASSDTIYVGTKFIGYDPATGNTRASDDQILFVMGHETAHVQRDHCALYDRARQEFSRDFDDKFLREGRLSPEDKAYCAQVARMTMHKDFNQAQELEADRVGAYLALAAGAKPQGIVQTFQRMEADRAAAQAAAAAGANPPTGADIQTDKGAATHPEPLDRLALLEQRYKSRWR